eukprot:SAG31_NODE_3030_length_4767_cov_3.085904_2_plen_235_part_00
MAGNEVRRLFDECDADGSGMLEAKEIESLCKTMGKKLNKKGRQAAMAEMDSDGSGSVSFDEFNAWWRENGGKALENFPAAAEAEDPAIEGTGAEAAEVQEDSEATASQSARLSAGVASKGTLSVLYQDEVRLRIDQTGQEKDPDHTNVDGTDTVTAISDSNAAATFFRKEPSLTVGQRFVAGIARSDLDLKRREAMDGWETLEARLQAARQQRQGRLRRQQEHASGNEPMQPPA